MSNNKAISNIQKNIPSSEALRQAAFQTGRNNQLSEDREYTYNHKTGTLD